MPEIYLDQLKKPLISNAPKAFCTLEVGRSSKSYFKISIEEKKS